MSLLLLLLCNFLWKTTDQTNCGATINTFWCPVQIMMKTRKIHINAYGKWGKIKAQKRSCYPFSIQSKNEHCICMRTPERKSVTITLHYQQPITTSIHLQFITWSTLFVLWICTWMDLEKKCVPDLHSRGINKNQNQFADFGHFFLALAFDSIQSHFILRSNSHH